MARESYRAERWMIHETRGAGLVRRGDFNAVVAGRALNEGEKVEVVRADAYEGAVDVLRRLVESDDVLHDDDARSVELGIVAGLARQHLRGQ